MLQENPEFDKREIQHVISSPMVHEPEPDTKNRTRLKLGSLYLGESLFVPFELVHEPSLRVKLARANMLPLGPRFKLVKHGAPAYGYEIACVSGPMREHVGSEESEQESETDAVADKPAFMPPQEDDA